jgi:hypothetical protein
MIRSWTTDARLGFIAAHRDGAQLDSEEPQLRQSFQIFREITTSAGLAAWDRSSRDGVASL